MVREGGWLFWIAYFPGWRSVKQVRGFGEGRCADVD